MFVPAQPPPPKPTLQVSVSPDKAGTAAAPRPVALRLAIDDKTGPASSIVVYFPQALRLSNAGLPQCARSDDEILAGACKTSIAGSGTARVPSADGPIEITPLVGVDDLLFRVDAGDDRAVLHGALSQASGRYTAKMRLELPGFLREFTRLSITMRLKRGGSSLFATRGCGLPFRVDLRGKSAASLRESAPCRR